MIEEIVCQVGYLPELYEDARSEKYKIVLYTCRIRWLLCCSLELVPVLELYRHRTVVSVRHIMKSNLHTKTQSKSVFGERISINLHICIQSHIVLTSKLKIQTIPFFWFKSHLALSTLKTKLAQCGFQLAKCCGELMG